jgi:hypothetical protein
MANDRRRLPRVLADLGLALLNATLILVALCLFLAWQTARQMNDLAGTFAQNLIEVEPLRDELRQTRAEIGGLRDDLAGLGSAGGALSDSAEAGIAALQTRVDGMVGRLDALAGAPERLTAMAVTQITDGMARTITRFSGCVPGPLVEGTSLPPQS